MSSEKSERDLLREAQRTSYGLRSLFFHRKLKEGELDKLIDIINKIDYKKYDWSDLESFGISKTAWNYLRKNKIPSPTIFCHPKIIQENPRLIAYYRCIAGLSQKGLSTIASSVAELEMGRGKPLSDDRAALLAGTINEFISAVVDSDTDYSPIDTIRLLFATFGTQIQGAWLNQIGEEASKQVKAMLNKYFLDEQLMAEVIMLDGSKAKPTDEISVQEILGFITTNGGKIQFGSEPDVAVTSADDELLGIIEIKGGIDEAGALERYGAAKKTFDEALSKNPRAFTMYLASCITPTVRTRIEADRAVRKTVNLTNVLLDEKERLKFLEEIRWWLRL